MQLNNQTMYNVKESETLNDSSSGRRRRSLDVISRKGIMRLTSVSLTSSDILFVFVNFSKLFIFLEPLSDLFVLVDFFDLFVLFDVIAVGVDVDWTFNDDWTMQRKRDFARRLILCS